MARLDLGRVVGATFTPQINEGILSWTNNAGLDNPTPVNIIGPTGPEGPQGPPGQDTVIKVNGEKVTEVNFVEDPQAQLDKKQPKGNYATVEDLTSGLETKQPIGDYATVEELNSGLETKQNKGNYATVDELNSGLGTKQDKGNYVTTDTEQTISGTKTFSAIVNLSGIICSGDVTITGNLNIDGSTYETHAEQIYSTKDYIFLREGNTAALTDGQYSGFEFIKYNGTDNGRLVIDNRGIARVGDVGDEQPLATREEEPINGGFAKWDSSSNRFVTDVNVASTVILSMTSDRVVDDIITLTDEEVKKLSILPQFLILKLTDINVNYSFSYFQSTSGIYIYLMSERFNDQNISLELRYHKSLKQLGLIADNYEYTLVKVNNNNQDVINFTSDPQTQLNTKYVKPTSGIPLSDLSSDIQLKINNIPSIEANPSLAGNEQSLTSLQINGTSYKIEAGSSLTDEEVTALRNLLSKVTVGTNVVFNTTVEAPAFNDTN